MLFFLGTYLVLMLLVWPFLVLLHELGHALPALVFTRSKVDVYLGSHGDSANSWRMRVGLLEIYLTKRHVFWAGGLCVPSRPEDMSQAQQVVMLLGGVTMSLVVAVLGFVGALVFDLHGSIKLFLFLLSFMAVVTLVTNLAPVKHAGGASDGLLLKQLLTGNRLAAKLSPELLALIARSREVALDLGCDYISTQHLFLADCAMPYPHSLANAFFSTPGAQAAFYEQCRVGPANPNGGSMPLTEEFERALKGAPLACRHGLGQVLSPSHLLLAAAELPDSEFVRIAPGPALLPQLLLAHYRAFDDLWAP